jgi:hypothetical protein
MSADFNKPVTSDAYTSVLSEIRDISAALAQMFDGAMGFSNTPTDAIRFNKASGVFQKWNGSSWLTVTLATAAIANAAITSALIADGNVTGAKLASGAAVANIGYTPANKAGDTFTGNVVVSTNAPAFQTTETDSSNKVWLWGGVAGATGIYEDNLSTPRLTIAQGASVLAVGATLTFGGSLVWHAGNDGATSGLDADLVDGQHMSTTSSPQLGSLGLGIAAAATSKLIVSWTGSSNAVNRAVDVAYTNDTTTLTASRTQHAARFAFNNVHWDVSGNTMTPVGVEGVVTSGGVGVKGAATAAYGLKGSVINASDQTANNVIANAYGVYGYVSSSNANAKITTAYGLYGEINAADVSAITTAYQLYVTYSGTTPTGAQGLRQVGSVPNRFDGNLGIGKAPSIALDVLGAIGATTTITAGTQVLGGGSNAITAPDFSFVGDANSGLWRRAADKIDLVTGGTSRIQIDDAGLVGINATPATYQLTVSGSLSATSFYEGATAITAVYARLGAANAFTVGGHSISVGAAITSALTLTSTDASASDFQALTIDRNSASPAAADIVGSLNYQGRSSTGATRIYAGLQVAIVDATNTSEDGQVNVLTMVAGTEASRMSIAQGMWMTGATGTDKGVGTFNATTLYQNGAVASPLGKNTVTFEARAFKARTTNGASSYSSESATNKVMIDGFSFSPTTAQFIQKRIPMPKGWDGGSIDVVLDWCRATGTSSVNTRWGAQAVVIDNGDLFDSAFGTAVEATTASDTVALKKTSTTLSSITPGGTFGSTGRTLILQIYRDVTDAADTMDSDAAIITDVTVLFTLSAANDA